MSTRVVDELRRKINEANYMQPDLTCARQQQRILIEALYELEDALIAREAKAREEERERCAKIAAEYEPQHEANTQIAKQVANNIAAAICARSQPPPITTPREKDYGI